MNEAAAQELVRKLGERYGTLEKAAAATGYDVSWLRARAAGAPCSGGALRRLRDTAEAPVGRRASWR